MREETCVILDFLPNGYAERRHPEPVAQGIGKQLTLLELVPKEGVTLKPEEEVYVGEGPRDKIRTVKGVLDFSRLTNFARGMLPTVVEKLVKENEGKFVEFFNTAGTITPRMHKLELLPGIGKKHLQDIMEERRKKPFESVEEIQQRIHLAPDIWKIIVHRIMMELEGDEKYQVFVPIKGHKAQEIRQAMRSY